MGIIKLGSFHIIGITVRTSNQNEQSAKDIPALWNKFLSENIAGKIQNKLSDNVYCVYTDYEGDHTKPYTAFVGCKVSTLEQIPEGCRGMTFNDGNYEKFTAKGNLMDGIIWQEWLKIWEANLDRTFTADFEVYARLPKRSGQGEKAQNPENAEVEIFVAVN